MAKDVLGDMLTRIRNAVYVKLDEVEVPKNRLTQSLADILLQEGLVQRVLTSRSSKHQKKSSMFIRLKYYGTPSVSVITDLRRISRPGLRIYTSHKEIPKGDWGLIILSTSRGLVTDHKARHYKLGGEIICSISLFV
jgi:small subunit ribosomal protein S8